MTAWGEGVAAATLARFLPCFFPFKPRDEGGGVNGIDGVVDFRFFGGMLNSVANSYQLS